MNRLHFVSIHGKEFEKCPNPNVFVVTTPDSNRQLSKILKY